jgi:hypothetical protein
MPCVCTLEMCGHTPGERCGKPVETVIKHSVGTDEVNFGPEQTTGICDECWENAKLQLPYLFQ